MAVLSIGQVWATDIVIDLDLSKAATYPSGFPTASGTKTGTYTLGGYDFSFSCNDAFYFSTSYLMIGKSSKTVSSYITFPAIEDYKLTEVKLTASSGTSTNVAASIQDGSGNVLTGGTGWAFVQSGSNTWTLTETSANTAYKVCIYKNNTNNSTYNAQVAGLKLTYSPTGSTPPTPTCAKPTFDPEDGETFTDDIDVEIAAESGTTIYYTTDGEDPTTSSDVYTTALNFTETTTLKAIAVKEGSNNSAVATATYTKVEPFSGSILEIVKGDFTTTSYDSNNGDHEKSGITFTTNKVYQSASSIQFQKSNGLLYNKTDLGEISKIEITTYTGKANNLVVYSGTTENPTSGAVTGSISGSVTTYTFAAGKGFFAIKCNSTGASNVDPIKIYYTSSASSVAKPTISGTDNFLTSTEVTMECSTEGAAIYYTITESAKATPATSGDWAAYNGASKPSFSATTTVWAAAKLGDDWSAVAEQTFTKATVMTVAQALETAAKGDNKYAKGIIYAIDEVSTQHGNATYYLKDEGQENSIKIYRGKYLGNVNFTAEDQIYEGDEVTVFGTISEYSSANQFAQGNYIVALKPAARLAWSEASFDAELEGANTFPSLTNTNSVAVTYSSSDETVATISSDGSTYELKKVGETTITASFAGNDQYKAKSVSYTLNVKNSVIRADISFEENGGSEVADLTNQSNLPDPLPTITKAGKNFGGWWTTSTFEDGTQAVAGAAVESTDPITLYAKWLEPYTVAEALAMIDAMENNAVAENSIYVTGKVCVAPDAAPNSGRLTYFISADGDPASDQFQIYLGYGVSGANFTAQTDVQLVDAVVAYGKLKKYVKSTVVYPEFDKGSQLYSLVRKADPELAWSETSFDAYIGESNTFPTLTNDHNVAVTYSSTETDYATISNEEGHEGEITLKAVGATVIKATFAGDETYKPAEVSYTLNVYEPITSGTITYEENGGSEVADVETPVENLPDPLPEPTKENNIFAGWWTTSTFDENTQAVAGAPMSGDIILYAKWIEIPYYATVYTSNVDFVGAGDSHESNSKVVINTVEYAAQKVGTSKGATGTVVVTVPAKTNTLHFHIFTWKNQSNTISISGDLTNLSASTINVDGDDAGGGSTPYNIESNPVDHYQFITFDPVAAPTEITFAHSAGTETRFIMYGINQEGGVLPVLDHIVITGDATELEYEVGDEFNPAGLGVNAIYTLESVEQDPVAVDAADIEWSFNPAHIAANTESVTVTATYNEKSANKTVTGIIVNVPAPEILVNPASVAFGNVNQDDVVEAEVINVTLKSVENATIALTGDVDAFTLDKTALTANGTISVTPVTSVAGTFAATITISDDASAAESKEVALSMTVKAPEIPDVCDGTDDFATIDKTVSPTGYATRTTTDGWVGTNVRFQEIDEKMYWKINGKTTAVGTITSPVLSDGIATLKFRYANTDNESNGVSVKIEIKQSGDVVKEYTLTKANSEVTKDEVYTEIIENINVAGDFQIVFTNLSPSNSTSNKDRVAIGRLCWTGYTAPEPPVVNYTEVRNGLTEGWYYTMCLDKAVTAVKAGSIWKVLSKAANGNDVILEEVTGTLDAGRPYIFRAAASTLEVAYTGDAVLAPVTEGNNGLVGSFTEEPLAQNSNHYIIYNNALYYVNSDNVKVGAHRAYLNMNGVPNYEPQQGNAPRRRVTMTVYNEQTTTDIDALNAAETPVKVMINGQMYILRGEKMYNVNGQVVK